LADPDFKLPFILTTDASKTSVAAILFQVQNGQERPIEYSSRQLNSAEQKYSATESEMLALVWATKHFRCYLFGKCFLVRTDHSALAYLWKFADHNSRLLKWRLKLCELDLEVQHRPGTQISHVDALSRHVGAITHSNSLEKQNVLKEQKADAFCGTLNQGTYSSKTEFFLDNDGVIPTSEKRETSASNAANFDQKCNPRESQP
jgi:hypothetical protein